jgi:hypothetical protein
MRVFKHIQFNEGIKCSLVEFKKIFKSHLTRLSDKEVKQAYKVATNGNISKSIRESKKVDTEEDKK